MKIGYARVSTADQNLDLQFNALTDYGCTTIYQEKISGKNTDRPELKNLLATLRKGDRVVVWKLDRLGRSLRDLVDLVAVFNEKGVNFVSLYDHIDTTTATGRFTFNIFASLAEFEREIIRERTKAGLVAARARGKKGGRPSGLSPEKLQLAMTALDLHDTGKYSILEISKRLQIPIATCYRYIKYARMDTVN
ncbi:resolvase [Pedobacter quisquiliarum]|jgi:DNA invertase Pin-like site-specific DNA recombinase|uniref:Resolvase n=1 Tax=Pedobacter quisquiliarum TaxID=1834438 RepID=A0A916UKG6_9SPHI|nr:recombinase family protein [Pedobacter quisquiliarum]GGC75984.1 resolvase [Pedobacter quisquiliarum]